MFPRLPFMPLPHHIIERRLESRSIGSDGNHKQWEQFDTTLCHRLRIWPTCFAIIQDRYLDSMYVHIHTIRPTVHECSCWNERIVPTYFICSKRTKEELAMKGGAFSYALWPADLYWSIIRTLIYQKISNCANRTAVPTRKVPIYFAHAVTRINAERMEWRARERWKFPVAFEEKKKKKKKKGHDHVRSSVDARAALRA